MKKTGNKPNRKSDADRSRLKVKSCNVEKLKFQNKEFDRLANEKSNDYMQEMVGVVGIKTSDDAYEIMVFHFHISYNRIKSQM